MQFFDSSSDISLWVWPVILVALVGLAFLNGWLEKRKTSRQDSAGSRPPGSKKESQPDNPGPGQD
ncbi:MAG: hypothetical protein VB089_19475 [Anaerolineaceae bacterium]|nr:hypothetical protein [Anaerolineaceae bacterium]